MRRRIRSGLLPIVVKTIMPACDPCSWCQTASAKRDNRPSDIRTNFFVGELDNHIA